MPTPTPDELRAASPLLTLKLPDDTGGPNDAALNARAAEAATLVSSLTFRTIEPVTSSTVEGWDFEGVPDDLVPLATRAIALMVEHEVVTGAADFAERLATGRLLRGFSAGPYSEQYFAPGEFARRGASQGRPPMDPDERLDTVLWALATEDAREYFVFMATGQSAPAGQAVAFSYRRQNLGYGAGAVGYPTRGGPDGW